VKRLLEGFKRFLTEGELEDYDSGGMMTLYHYGKSDEDTLTLDPNYFLSSTSRHSRNEKEVSMVPRVFFYADKENTEAIIARDYGRKLFATEVPHSEIYNLKNDRNLENFIGFIKENREKEEGLPIGLQLRTGIDWDNLLNLIKEKYNGIFYSIGQPDIVAWFEPIEIYKVNEKEGE